MMLCNAKYKNDVFFLQEPKLAIISKTNFIYVKFWKTFITKILFIITVNTISEKKIVAEFHQWTFMKFMLCV